MALGIEAVDWSAALSGVVRGEYSLLLGAGASLDSSRQSGATVPGVSKLVEELVAEFAVPSAPQRLTLSRAYEAASLRRSSDGLTVFEWLNREFTDTRPAAWYEHICSCRWRTIWTLNIDDVVERAYADFARIREQDAVSVSWRNRFRRPDQGLDELQIVHLHGSASRLLHDDASSELVFSIVEYLRAVERRHAWHHVFNDDFQAEPFVVVGASLVDEFDLASIVRRGNTAATELGRPSLFVAPEIDDLQEQELRSWGLIPVRASAEAFFSQLAVDVRRYEAEFAAATPGQKTEIPRHALRFLAQFRSLRDYRPPQPAGQDLYAGHEPTWSDILADRDARFEAVAQLETRAAERLTEAEPGARLVTVTGPPFVGKTAALLRTARQLLKRGFDVYLFDADERLDVEAVGWWIANSGPSVLVFDGLADHSPDLSYLSEELAASENALVILGAERSSRRSILYSNLPEDVMSDADLVEMGSLTNSDIKALVGKLRAQRRLGLISDRSRAAQEEYFRTAAGRSLAEGLAPLESGRGFVDRLRTQYESIGSIELQEAYSMSCIAYAFGYGVPIGILASSVGLTTQELRSAYAPAGPLSDVVRPQGRNLRPRHRRLASLVVDNVLSSDDRFALTQRLAENLAPYVTPDSVRQRLLPYRIARELMNNRVVADWFESSVWDAWYEALRSSYDWNARYWEQRALVLARLKEFDRAESYAAHALKIYRDSFTLTTLGSVLLRKASQWETPFSDSSLEYFRRAVACLEEARDGEGGRQEPPFLAFFDGTLELVERGRPSRNDSRLALIEGEWNRWYLAASALALFQREETRRELQARHDRWSALIDRLT